MTCMNDYSYLIELETSHRTTLGNPHMHFNKRSDCKPPVALLCHLTSPPLTETPVLALYKKKKKERTQKNKILKK